MGENLTGHFCYPKAVHHFVLLLRTKTGTVLTKRTARVSLGWCVWQGLHFSQSVSHLVSQRSKMASCPHLLLLYRRGRKGHKKRKQVHTFETGPLSPLIFIVVLVRQIKKVYFRQKQTTKTTTPRSHWAREEEVGGV